jgi:hypothetical protein
MSKKITYKPGTLVKLKRSFKDWGLKQGNLCVVVTGDDTSRSYICRLLEGNELCRVDTTVPSNISGYNVLTDFTISPDFLEHWSEYEKINIRIKIPKT